MVSFVRKNMHKSDEYIPVNNISPYMYLLIIVSSFFFGCSYMYDFRVGSYENAIPASVSIIIFIHSICTIVTGVSTPINGPIIERLTANRFIVY